MQETQDQNVVQGPASPAPNLPTRLWRDWVRPVLPLVIVLLAFRSAVADWNDVPTGSMKPTIFEGDRIFVNKLAYDLRAPFVGWRVWSFDGPRRGDVIVFYAPRDGVRMVKRVVGLPGDTVELRDNRLHINGEPVAYGDDTSETSTWLSERDQTRTQALSEQLGGREHPVLLSTAGGSALGDFGPSRVPEGHYFVMGDNRDNSADSRIWGSVPRGRIAGRATRILVSIDTARWWPRWGRFLHRLE